MKQLLPVLFIAIFVGGCAATSEPEKPFHPTDALLIGGNGPFNAKPDAEDISNIDLESNQ